MGAGSVPSSRPSRTDAPAHDLGTLTAAPAALPGRGTDLRHDRCEECRDADRPRAPVRRGSVPPMGRRLRSAHGTAAACATALVAGARRPARRAGPAAADEPRPTVDPSRTHADRALRRAARPRGTAPDGQHRRRRGPGHPRTWSSPTTRPALPAGLAAAGWLVADAGTGEVLAARDPHGRYYPASTLKTLTLLTLAPLLDPAQVVVGTAEDENIEGSRVGLVAGRPVPRGAALPGADAAVGQRRGQRAGPRRRRRRRSTVEAMNETAEEHRRLRHRRRDAVRARRRRAVLLALRPGADLPRADRRPGHRRGPAPPRRPQMPAGRGPLPRLPDPEPEPAARRPTRATSAARPASPTPPGTRSSPPPSATAAGSSSASWTPRTCPLRAADQAALLLDWGFAVPAGTDGVGTLVDPGDLPPAPPTPDAPPPRPRGPPPTGAGRARPTTAVPAGAGRPGGGAVADRGGDRWSAGGARCGRRPPAAAGRPPVRRPPAPSSAGGGGRRLDPRGGSPSTRP